VLEERVLGAWNDVFRDGGEGVLHGFEILEVWNAMLLVF
jgi:hypothetical protein